MSDVACALALIAVLGFLLVVLGKPVSEAFTVNDSIRCGVDQAPCPAGTKCINGFCGRTEARTPHDPNPVPLLQGPVPYTA